MGTADELLDEIFSWIKQREHFAEQLTQLAQELESLRKKCNAAETYGSSVSVVGSACVLGAGIATLFTGGAAAPPLLTAGTVYGGVGLATSVITKLTEHLLSSGTMKKAIELEKKSNDIAKNIKNLFDKLKAKIGTATSFANTDELEKNIFTNILIAVAKREQIHIKIEIPNLKINSPHFFKDNMDLNFAEDSNYTTLVGFIGVCNILQCFGCGLNGKTLKWCLSEKGLAYIINRMSSVATGVCGAAEKLITNLQKSMATVGFKTAVKGVTMVSNYLDELR